MDQHRLHAEQIARLTAHSNAALNHRRTVEVNACYSALCAIAEECARECGADSPYAGRDLPQPYYPSGPPPICPQVREMLAGFARAIDPRRLLSRAPVEADTSKDTGEHAGEPAPSTAPFTHN